MKRFLFGIFILLITCSSTLVAQDLDINWGRAFEGKTSVEKILGFTGDKMVTFSVKGGRDYIETFDKEDLRLKSSREYVYPELGEREDGIMNMVLMDDKVTFILYSYKKKTKSFALYAHTVDLKAKEVRKVKKIFQSDAMDEKIRSKVVDMRFSPDNSKILVFFNRSNKKYTEYYSDVVVLNVAEDIEVMSESEFTFSTDDASDDISFRLFPYVENDGSFSLLQEKRCIKRTKVTDYVLKVDRYDHEGKKLGSVNIKQDDKVLLSPTIIVEDDKIVLAGYYSSFDKDKFFKAGYTGIFFAELSLEMELNFIKTTRFSDEFLTNIYSEKKVAKFNKKGKELRVPDAYTMDMIYSHENGTYTILSEFFTVYTYQNKGGNTTVTTYGNILYFKLNEKGELFAADAIKKLQTSSTKSLGLGYGMTFVSVEFADKKAKYWSYTTLNNGSDIYIVFNDHYKNANDDIDEVSKALRNPDRSVPYLVTINEEGEFTKEAVFDSGDAQTNMIPRVVYHMSNNQLVILASKRKSQKFGVVEVETED